MKLLQILNKSSIQEKLESLYNQVLDSLWNWRFILLVITFSAIPHAVNMFNYPYFENDEGVYISQAWSVAEKGQLAPYTYWYDHAPAGWLFTALISLFTGGIFSFGLSLNFGRVLMLVFHVINSLILYFSLLRATKKNWVGLVSVILYSFSPLGLYYHRRFLLDTIMMFWVLLTYWLITGKKDLRYTVGSAVAFGLAILTKESAVFFGPAFLGLLLFRYKKFYRWVQATYWSVLVGAIVSFYPLFALLKNEFFPDPTGARVSLLGTLQLQLGRGDSYPFWSNQSSIWYNFLVWWERDPLIVIIGIISLLLSLIGSFFEKHLRLPIALAFSYIFFLIRGKLVIDFYLIPLLVLVPICFGLIWNLVLSHLPKAAQVGGIILALFLAFSPALQTLEPYTVNEVKAYRQALDWVRKNVDEDEFVIIDASMWSDLRATSQSSDLHYANAEWFWKAETDPEIRDEKLEQDWRKVDYVVLSHEMVKQMSEDNAPYLTDIMSRSYLVRQWLPRSETYIDIPQKISTNGDWMAIYKVKDELDYVMETSWEYYKDNFIVSYGQVIDPATKATYSEGQAYAMLRSVMMNDPKTFSGVWQWTQDHMQHRQKDELISWKWDGDEETGSISDPNSAVDADLDAALALIMAADKWSSEEYLNDAQVLLDSIWQQTVIQVGDRYLLIGGTAHLVDNTYAIVNPSYFSPAWYRVFAEIDRTHDWNQLADDSYYWLERIENEYSFLPPNWILVNIQTNNLMSAEGFVSGSTSEYGFDAFRTFWRIAYDYQWYETQAAVDYFDEYQVFFENELSSGESLASVYGTDAEAAVSYKNPSVMTAPLAVYSVNDPESMDLLYDQFLKSEYSEEGYWGEPKNYYDQNWAWFATALVNNRLEKPEISE